MRTNLELDKPVLTLVLVAENQMILKGKDVEEIYIIFSFWDYFDTTGDKSCNIVSEHGIQYIITVFFVRSVFF